MRSQQHCRTSENNGIPEFPDQETQIVLLRPGFELIIGDYQVARRVKVNFDSCNNTCEFVFFLSGKIRSWIYGFRKDMEITPLFAALWLTPRLDSYTNYFPGPDVRFACVRVNRLLLAEIAGEYLRQVPEDFRHRHVIGFFGRVDILGVSSFYSDAKNDVKVDGYELVNLRLGYEGEHLDIVFWGKNVFDKEYSANEWDWAGATVIQEGAPRMLGVTMTYRF